MNKVLFVIEITLIMVIFSGCGQSTTSSKNTPNDKLDTLGNSPTLLEIEKFINKKIINDIQFINDIDPSQPTKQETFSIENDGRTTYAIYNKSGLDQVWIFNLQDIKIALDKSDSHNIKFICLQNYCIEFSSYKNRQSLYSNILDGTNCSFSSDENVLPVYNALLKAQNITNP